MTDTNSLERYSRQMRFPGIGKAGQEKLLASRVTLCGCGALGTVLANTLVRAGVGFVRVIDRDFVEPSNLQRQVLFDESDVANNMPKAEAAAIKLRQINSSVAVEPVVADINRTNIEDFCKDADLILDGSDNFEIRYLINDVSIKHNKPWVYGGRGVGSEGMTMTIIPGETPCLRCVFEAAPAPWRNGNVRNGRRAGPDREHRGELSGDRSHQVALGKQSRVNRELLVLNVWENSNRRVKVSPLAGRKGKCPCARSGTSSGSKELHGTQTTTLCGRNAVQVSHRAASKLDFAYLATVLKQTGTVSYNKFLLKFNLVENGDPYEFTVFPDGRAIIKGTSEPDKARTLYAKYVGH